MTINSSIDAIFESANRAHQDGRVDAALEGYNRVLAQAPAHVGALYLKALLAFQSGRLHDSLALLRAALDVAPDDVEIQFRLGLVLLVGGRVEESLAPLERAAAMLPQWFEPPLKLGRANMILGRREQAQNWFQRALLTTPNLAKTAYDESKSREYRQEMLAALGVLGERQWAIASGALAAAASAHPSADLARVERGLRIICGREERTFKHPLSRPTFFCMPDLPATPWFEREQFDWVPGVEERLPAVREELERLVREEAEFVPYVAEDVGDTASGNLSSLAGSLEWSAFHLRTGDWLEERCRRCPETAAVMRDVPCPVLPGFSPEIFFSRLRGGSHIVPHFGLMNVRLTVHMGVVIPPDCAIRVGEETRVWQEGHVMAFDDSFEHEAWNRSDRDRSVLIFEAWNPALEPAEIVAIEHFFDARKAWIDLCTPPKPQESGDSRST